MENKVQNLIDAEINLAKFFIQEFKLPYKRNENITLDPRNIPIDKLELIKSSVETLINKKNIFHTFIFLTKKNIIPFIGKIEFQLKRMMDDAPQNVKVNYDNLLQKYYVALENYLKSKKTESSPNVNKKIDKDQTSIEINGQQKHTHTNKGTPIHPTEEGVKNFWKWFEGSKVIDEDGKPLIVYHGTTADFSEFKKDNLNIESDLGGGFYFTNNHLDVGSNYAGRGPDLTARIEKTAEQIQQNSDKKIDWDDAIKQAEKKFMKHGGMSIPSFLQIKNPVIIGGGRKKETFLNFEEIYDEEAEEYGEPSGKIMEFINAFREIGNEERYSETNIEKSISLLMDHVYDNNGISASNLIELLKNSDGLMYAQDDESEEYAMASSEIIRRTFEEIGFDGFIDYTVDTKFGSNRKGGQKMVGVDNSTTHYVVFNPNQIKSAIGNVGTYSPHSNKIIESILYNKYTRKNNFI